LKLIEIKPNDSGDWINHRNDSFSNFIEIGSKKDSNCKSFFLPFYSNGIKSNRDVWVYNFSKTELIKNINKTILFYNNELHRYNEIIKTNPNLEPDSILDFDSNSFISWSGDLVALVKKNISLNYEEVSLRKTMYRPYIKQNLYFNRELNNSIYLIPKLFPNPSINNKVICVSGVGVTKDFSCIITDTLPDLELIGKSQCFPLWYYEENDNTEKTLFDNNIENTGIIRRDAISDFILTRAKIQYGKNVTKEDIFYYVYGILHSTEYKATFVNDLKKMLPRLPLLESVKDFWAFSKAGRELAELHLNYEKVSPYLGVIVNGDDSQSYRVDKMRFPSKGQKDTIIYNSKITISNIPEEAYEYVVNGKSAIEWIMERYQVTIDKKSGIKNDPNDWATEVGNPRYILDLLLSIINVSVKTMEIVKSLPKVKFE